jgi:hypothetical protein
MEGCEVTFEVDTRSVSGVVVFGLDSGEEGGGYYTVEVPAIYLSADNPLRSKLVAAFYLYVYARYQQSPVWDSVSVIDMEYMHQGVRVYSVSVGTDGWIEEMYLSPAEDKVIFCADDDDCDTMLGHVTLSPDLISVGA